MSDERIVILSETTGESIKRDVVSFGMLFILIGAGVAMDSSAMQWAGFILGALSIIGRAARILKSSPRYTPQAAADMLSKDFGVTAGRQSDEGGES